HVSPPFVAGGGFGYRCDQARFAELDEGRVEVAGRVGGGQLARGDIGVGAAPRVQVPAVTQVERDPSGQVDHVQQAACRIEDESGPGLRVEAGDDAVDARIAGGRVGISV